MQTCMSKNVVNCNSVTVELPIWWQAHLANDYVKEGQSSACQVHGTVAATVYIASKAVISTENN